MPRIVSRRAFIRSARKPKRRFQVLALDDTGSATLHSPLQAPRYWFERREEVIDGQGRFTIDPSQATITLMVDGVASVMFYLVGRRLDACTFALDLTPEQVAGAVAAMKRAALGRLIAKAARHALEELPEGRRTALTSALRRLVPRPRRKIRAPR